ncbi:hypothetical protein SOVF_166600, partial [Spinacia oleracea]
MSPRTRGGPSCRTRGGLGRGGSSSRGRGGFKSGGTSTGSGRTLRSLPKSVENSDDVPLKDIVKGIGKRKTIATKKRPRPVLQQQDVPPVKPPTKKRKAVTFEEPTNTSGGDADNVETKPSDAQTNRVKLEMSCKSFGCGLLDSRIYLVSEKLVFVDGQVYTGEDIADAALRANQANQTSSDEGRGDQHARQREICFRLPPGSMSDDDIRAIAVDKVYENFLFMRRDMEIVSNFYMDQIKELLCSMHHEPTLSSPQISQSDAFFSDPRVHAIVDEIAKLVIWVTKLPGGLDNIAAF